MTIEQRLQANGTSGGGGSAARRAARNPAGRKANPPFEGGDHLGLGHGNDNDRGDMRENTRT